MAKAHEYELTVRWTGNEGSGTSTYRGYSRSHTVQAAGKATIVCSSDPAFRGDASSWNPEELFVASLSQCHMLWYLHLAADAGVVVVDYVDAPRGVMREDWDGGGEFEVVTLRPVVTVNNKSMVDDAILLHDRVREVCFIARSVKFAVGHEPKVRVAEAVS